jgi:hypothetical protein
MIKFAEDEEDVKKDINFLSSRLESSDLKKRYKDALKTIQTLSRELEAVNAMKQVDDNYVVIERGKRSSEATPVILASDWHIEEIIKPETVNGLNEFNLKIAEMRVDYFFANSVKLIKLFQKDVKINNVILWLGGDFFSGSIHEELMENTSLRPIEAIMKVQEFLIGGIKHLLTKTNCRLIIPCSVGNHSRVTNKTHISTEHGNSLEYYMYHNLSKYFSKEKRVEILVSNGYHLYLKVYDYQLRFHHGHQMKYLGGVSGLSLPALKAIAQWDKGKRADFDFFGHFHNFQRHGKFISNGSLIGYNAYALSLKATYEPPTQIFTLIDKEHGLTVNCPIFLR